MKIEKISENSFNVYLNKFYLKNSDLETKTDLEEYFKSFFLTLKKYYHISMEGFYVIQVYQDSYYGIVLHIVKEDFEYFDLEVVDMRIRLKKSCFLYHLEDEDGLESLLSFGDFYQINDHLYLKLNKDLNNYQLGQLEEFTTLIFEDTDLLLKQAKAIKIVI